MNLIILGPPGAGKGTLAKRICDNYHLEHISTGDLFRANITAKTPLGQLAQSYIEKGALVPDEVTNDMVEDRLGKLDNKGFMLDGFPRNIEQAQALQTMLEKLSLTLTGAINVSLSDDLITARLVGRRVCRSCGASYNIDYMKPKVSGICDRCGGELYQRKDDTADTIHHRLETYHRITQPLIDYYQATGQLITVENSGSAQDTEAFVIRALERRLDTLDR